MHGGTPPRGVVQGWSKLLPHARADRRRSARGCAFLLAYQLVGFRAPMPGRAFAAFANTFSVLGIRKEFADPNTIKVFLR